MSAARFCSRCGERIKIRRPGALNLGSYCRDCTPKHQRPVVLLATVCVSCVAIGFALGKYTGSTKPFQFIGTPVEFSASRVSQPVGPASEKPASENVPRPAVLSQRATEHICGAPTKSGRPCQRKVKVGGYCWQHRGREDRSAGVPAR